MQSIPTIDDLNKELREHRAAQYCDNFRGAVNRFFYTGNKNRKHKARNKPVEHLTELIWLCMMRGALGCGLSAQDKKTLKKGRKKVEAAIASVPTQDTMAKACAAEIQSTQDSQRPDHAIFRARQAIFAMNDIHDMVVHDIVVCGNVMHDIIVGGHWLDKMILHVAHLEPFFFDIADMLREE